jgi:hypothetical protein
VEKVILLIDGQRARLRATRPYCPHCRANEAQVVINRKSLPEDKQSLLSKGKPVEVCLGCLEFGVYRHRSELIFRAISLPADTRLELDLMAVAT